MTADELGEVAFNAWRESFSKQSGLVFWHMIHGDNRERWNKVALAVVEAAEVGAILPEPKFPADDLAEEPPVLRGVTSNSSRFTRQTPYSPAIRPTPSAGS